MVYDHIYIMYKYYKMHPFAWLQKCPWDPVLRERRAACYIALGDKVKAISDIKPTAKLRNDNTEAHYKISMLYYEMGEPDESLVYVGFIFTSLFWH